MLKINQIKLDINHEKSDVLRSVLRLLKVKEEDIKEWYIDKVSIDARKKPSLFYVYSVCVTVANETQVLNRNSKNKDIQKVVLKKYNFTPHGTMKLDHPPIIIGAGPAGLFCALELAELGYCPILLERGADVDQRIIDVEAFWRGDLLNLESNVQFGEGGAGTFSDGKLNTSVKDPYGRNRRVLETLVQHGAPNEILYDQKPHIGTDILMKVVKSIRMRIIELGGSVEFHKKVTGIIYNEFNELTGLEVNEKELFETSIAVLAIGHSARDTFQRLNEMKIPMEAKSFAIGVRVEHLQDMINTSQYGVNYSKNLPASSYKLVTQLENGRGVYSFCMCPGGYVVDSSSEENMLSINGMSYHLRNGINANSAIVVTVTPDDFNSNDVLAGMEFQRKLEHAAFIAGKGHVPVQLFGDYCNQRATTQLGTITPSIKGKYTLTNLREIFPEVIQESIELGIKAFGRKIKGFDQSDSVLSGVETRTSSPVKILRNETFESTIKGLYPCGEGAGYAGGITSAAIDGIKVFEAIADKYSAIK